ncbi:hypothetical protein [Microbispora sp. NPDC049125]|uniref:hypothetical protein n=1 Tax=Microbispora sp. NPDC049125 TaxID=3154929 RepID=UPI0034662925
MKRITVLRGPGRHRLTAVLLSAALGPPLAACSAAGPAPAASGSLAATATLATTGAQQGAAYRELARCFRAHGEPGFPDPAIDTASGRWSWPHRAIADLPKAAVDACQPIIRTFPGGEWLPAQSTADVARLRRFAACMREHGLSDYPDPDADGGFSLPRRLRNLGKGGMSSQLRACRQFMPGDSGTAADG